MLAAPSLALLLALSSAPQATGDDETTKESAEAPREPVPTDAAVEAAFARGVEILVGRQETLAGGEDRGARRADEGAGEWPYEGVYRFRRQIPIGYRVGGTSICAWALLEVPGRQDDAARLAAVERALDFVLAGLDDELMAAGFLDSYDVRGWGHAYALTFLLRLRELGAVPSARREAVDAKVLWLIDAIEETEIPERGGWNYSRRGGGGRPTPPSTFMTASTLQALFQAAAQGEQVDADVVGRALDALEAARVDNSAYQYAARPARKTGEGFEDVPGAIGRMAICESTLLLAGRGSVDRVRAAVHAFFEHWRWLEDRRRKNGTHEPPYGIAPYYYYYAHGYAGQAIELLPEAERPPLRTRLRATLWHVREESGGWNDRVFDRSENFGTAMALYALTRPLVDPPVKWEGIAREDQ